MSSATAILFNSPALHSLKRDQLVKLCKTHSLKANGKNVELIQRLKEHAKALPNDSPLSIAARSESEGSDDDSIPGDFPMGDVPQQEDNVDNPFSGTVNPRPSEQWEMVMDSIEEVDEDSSQGTLTSQRTATNNGTTGEFGIGGSKNSTVSSSIKALATSLGLKRSTSKATTTTNSNMPSCSSKRSGKSACAAVSEINDELAQTSTPYSALPQNTPPQTDHFILNSNRPSLDGSGAPLPGQAHLAGVPAPANARLSMGYGLGAPSTPTRDQPTTTIRLINPLSTSQASLPFSSDFGAGQNGTPQLKPFPTTFDLALGSPDAGGRASNYFNFGSMSTWPPSETPSIYPKLTADLMNPTMPSPTPTPSRKQQPQFKPTRPLETPSKKSTEPFVFGSPLPQHNLSNHQFRQAAQSILEEMNERLRDQGVDELTADIIHKLHPDAKVQQEIASRDMKPLPGSAKRGEVTDKFAKLHQKDAEKMEGIDSFVKRRAEKMDSLRPEADKLAGKKRKSGVIDEDGPRRPSVAARRASNTRVISNGRRAKALPGAFGLDEGEEEEDEEESERAGKRVRMDTEAEAKQASCSPSEVEDKKQKEREEAEREAIRKKLEISRARRRSSAAHGLTGRKSGRVSVGRPRPSVSGKAKPKPSRFGFLSTAKSLVQSVWGRNKTSAPPSSIPKATPAPKNDPPKTKEKEKMPPPSIVPAKKAAVLPARSTTLVASASRTTTSATNNLPKPEERLVPNKGSTSSSRRSRSPIPSFNSDGGSITSTTRSSLQSVASRGSFMNTNNSRLLGTGTTRTTNVSSIGTRLSTRTSSTGGPASSMGSKRTSVTSRTSGNTGGGSTTSRMSTTSRLLAPTASSLAKAAARNSVAGFGGGRGSGTLDRNKSPQPSALGSITNSPAFSPTNVGSPKPLLSPYQSGIPTPVKRTKSVVSTTSTATAATAASASGENKLVRSLSGRKPRISRSKVIARLASQRQTSGTSTASGKSTLAPRTSNGLGVKGKTRSSLGVKAANRASYGGAKARASSGGNPVLSAKKKARQSECARRRSKVGPLNFQEPAADTDVDVSVEDASL